MPPSSYRHIVVCGFTSSCESLLLPPEASDASNATQLSSSGTHGTRILISGCSRLLSPSPPLSSLDRLQHVVERKKQTVSKNNKVKIACLQKGEEVQGCAKQSVSAAELGLSGWQKLQRRRMELFRQSTNGAARKCPDIAPGVFAEVCCSNEPNLN